VKPLMVLTWYDILGNTSLKTGFWLKEFAAPYFVFRDTGVRLTLLRSTLASSRMSIMLGQEEIGVVLAG
jgi:putative intracellular protease/amidase